MEKGMELATILVYNPNQWREGYASVIAQINTIIPLMNLTTLAL